MPLSDVDVLRTSAIVKRIVSVKFDGIADSYVLKVRVELKNNWVMDYWEHKTLQLRRYSFHIFRDNKIVVRWDNSPHYPKVKTFPHHRHVGKKVQESEEMTVQKVLVELHKMIKG